MLESCDLNDFGERLRVAEAMPALESLACFGDACGSLAKAARGHPVVRKVSVDMSDPLDDDDGDGNAHDWWRAAASMPQLAEFSLSFKPTSFCEAEDQGDAGARARLAIIVNCLEEAPQLARLRIFTDFQLPAHLVLAKLGPAAGGHLESLELWGALLPAAPADAPRAFHALPLFFPRLADLSLSLAAPDATQDRGAAMAAAALAMLRPLDALLPRCPALSAVKVTPVMAALYDRSHFQCVAECVKSAARRPPRQGRGL